MSKKRRFGIRPRAKQIFGGNSRAPPVPRSTHVRPADQTTAADPTRPRWCAPPRSTDFRINSLRVFCDNKSRWTRGRETFKRVLTTAKSARREICRDITILFRIGRSANAVRGLAGTMMHFAAAVFVNTVCIIAALGHVEPTAIIARDVRETEMFYHEIRPELFNWTNGADTGFVFTPSLQNYPDLLHWIHYKFNSKNRHGYLYGTPPADSSDRHVLLDIIGLNKKTYQVETRVMQLNIFEKSEYATNEVRFKINNLNVEDMFHEERIQYLLDIFRQNLWLGSKPNLYVTFLASASDLGQRLPLDPNDTEGVIVNLGSSSNFSTILYDLEKEISPLQKMNKCPKDFKRTSVERYFRANGFNLDWCSFKLVELTIINQNNHTVNVQDKISSTKHTEENVWELMESLRYSQSMDGDTSKLSVTLLIFMIFVIGIILSIGVFRWHKKKVIFLKK